MITAADTIIYDIKKIAEYQSDGDYDYSSQTEMSGHSIFYMINRWLNRLLREIFDGDFADKYTSPVLICFFILVILAAVYFLYRKRPELFKRAKKTQPLPYDIENENIHEIDFNTEIAKAITAGNYRLAIRLVYLKTLRFLSDNKLIDWQIYKTPSEYLYEIKGDEIKKPFNELTDNFLKVRYGNYDVSEALYDEIVALHLKVKGGVT